MKILFVALTNPFPPTSGQRLKTWTLIQALIEEQHRVTVIVPVTPEDPLDTDQSSQVFCEQVVVVPVARGSHYPGAQYALRLLASPLRLPYGAWRFKSARLRRRVEQELRSRPYDLIFCDGDYNLANIPTRGPVPYLLNIHDVPHLLVERYLKLTRNPIEKLYGRMELQKCLRFERLSFQAPGLLVCSEFDKNLYQRLFPQARIWVAPNVVDTEKYLPRDDGAPLTVLYQGGMDWLPNRDAVEFFVWNILPGLRALVPGVKFVVAGKSPSFALRRRFASLSDVEFTGTVPDIRDETAQAAVCVVPLRIASATRLKILEAAAMAKPIVSTTVGAEGLSFADGREIVLADEPKAFAGAVAELLRDASRRRELGQAARRRVEECYSLPVLRTALRAAFAELSEGRLVQRR
jgi:glycosyltransferase involved in cell wall biosynthesis